VAKNKIYLAPTLLGANADAVAHAVHRFRV